MRYDKIMQEVLPKVLVEYFTIVDMRSQADKIEFWLDEKEYMEREDYKKGTVRSYGFTQSKTIQDFPLRGKPVFLHVRRRRWPDGRREQTHARVCRFFKRNVLSPVHPASVQ